MDDQLFAATIVADVTAAGITYFVQVTDSSKITAPPEEFYLVREQLQPAAGDTATDREFARRAEADAILARHGWRRKSGRVGEWTNGMTTIITSHCYIDRVPEWERETLEERDARQAAATPARRTGTLAAPEPAAVGPVAPVDLARAAVRDCGALDGPTSQLPCTEYRGHQVHPHGTATADRSGWHKHTSASGRVLHAWR